MMEQWLYIKTLEDSGQLASLLVTIDMTLVIY